MESSRRESRPGSFSFFAATVWFLAILAGLAVAFPISYLVLRSLGAGRQTLDLLLRVRTLEVLGRTLALMFAVTALSLSLSLPLAWLTVRTNLPLRRFFSVATALPLVIPSYIMGYLLIVVLGPRGMLQGFLGVLFGLDRIPEIYGFPGALLAITLVSYPYLLLPLQAVLKGLDPHLEEVSSSLGKKRLTTFIRVVFPQLRPAIAGGGLLVALYALWDFGAVSLMRYETFTWAIYLQYQTPFGGRMAAAALSLVLILIALLVLTLEVHNRRPIGEGGKNTSGSPPIYELGRLRWPAFILSSLVVLLSLILPLSVLIFWAARGILAGEPLRLVYSSALNSLSLSAIAAAVVLLFAFPVGYVSSRFSSWLASILERITYLGFSLPGIVVALALVFFGANYFRFFYQTIWILLFAYLVRFMPLAVGQIRSSLLQVDPKVEEAARNLGSSPTKTLFDVTIPLAKGGLFAGGALVFLTVMKELPATLLLGPIGFESLATSVWAATSEAFFARAAVPALLLIFLSSVPMGVLVFWQRRLN